MVGRYSLLGLALFQLAPALAQDPLQSLVPLIEVFAAEKTTPGFDVAGIRCGALFAAQLDWSEKHPGQRGPSRAQQADIDPNLTGAELHRQNVTKMDSSTAFSSTRDDVLRVVGLYTDRFRKNEANGGHPWNGDKLIMGDTAYCDIMRGRR